MEYLEPSHGVSSKCSLSFIIFYEHTATSQSILLITTATAFGTLSVIVVVIIIVIVCIIMYLKKRREEYEIGGMERLWMILIIVSIIVNSQAITHNPAYEEGM